MAIMKRLIFTSCSLLLVFGLGIQRTVAATWYLNENESGTVGVQVGDDSTTTGPYWFEYYGQAGFDATHTYANSSPRPNSGGKYIRIAVPANTHDGGMQLRNPSGLYGGSAFSEGSPVTLSRGATVYWGGFFRFHRVAGGGTTPIWDLSNGFDKFFEINSASSSSNAIRWIILTGWPGIYNGTWNDKFTFSMAFSPTYCGSYPGTCGPSPNGWNFYERTQNFNGHNDANPYLCDYDRWYSVIAKVVVDDTFGTHGGSASLYINGTEVWRETGIRTMRSGYTSATLGRLIMDTTWDQPDYSTAQHERQYDGLIATDDLTFLQNNGYFSDPEAGGDTTPPAAPTGLARE
jgi:hypothetical protein